MKGGEGHQYVIRKNSNVSPYFTCLKSRCRDATTYIYIYPKDPVMSEERDWAPYIPILFGWDFFHHQSYSIGKVHRIHGTNGIFAYMDG